jgi:CDP-diacylglycerol--glycerol-3-phosphate 3-phosphatidyltransferase
LSTPNLLTFFRIGTAPLLVYLLTLNGRMAAGIAAAVFLLATLSDYLDGYIARNYDSQTTLGKFLDPLADKIVVTAVLIMLAGVSRTPNVPAWMVVVIVAREILVTGLRAVAASEGKIIEAGELGKYKMALQAIALQALLIRYTYLHVDFFAAGMFVLWLAMIVSIWSGVDYYIKALAAMRRRSTDRVGKRAAI